MKVEKFPRMKGEGTPVDSRAHLETIRPIACSHDTEARKCMASRFRTRSALGAAVGRRSCPRPTASAQVPRETAATTAEPTRRLDPAGRTPAPRRVYQHGPETVGRNHRSTCVAVARLARALTPVDVPVTPRARGELATHRRPRPASGSRTPGAAASR